MHNPNWNSISPNSKPRLKKKIRKYFGRGGAEANLNSLSPNSKSKLKNVYIYKKMWGGERVVAHNPKSNSL